MSKVYIYVSDVPMMHVRTGSVIGGVAEDGTPEQLRLLAKQLVNNWIIDVPRKFPA